MPMRHKIKKLKILSIYMQPTLTETNSPLWMVLEHRNKLPGYPFFGTGITRYPSKPGYIQLEN